MIAHQSLTPKETLAELKFREPKAGDLRGIQLRDLNVVDVDTTLRLAARLSVGAPVVEAQLDDLHPLDLSQVAQVLTPWPISSCSPGAPR